MFVEFTLSDERPGPDLLLIRYRLVKWAEQYQIPYVEKTVKYTHRVCFDNDSEYTVFKLTWLPEWPKYKLVVDRNNRID